MIDAAVDEAHGARFADAISKNETAESGTIILTTGCSENSELSVSGAKYVQKPLSRKEILEQLGIT